MPICPRRPPVIKRRRGVEDFPAFIVVDDKGNDFFAHTGEVTLTVGKRPGL
ncbi:hypothetical protein G4X40_21670 [Rhodococcus sp. D2-41]|nr:fumarate hydratase C-terminal domain-containing protein [Rhodococcus sp. D2-41]MDG3012752.1 hypothetical protein [Rhodococcus sp. D2-41]